MSELQQNQEPKEVNPSVKNDQRSIMLNDEYSNDFIVLSEKTRGPFIIKVYAIVFTQLLVSTGMIFMSLYTPDYIPWTNNHLWLTIVCAIVSIISIYALACYPMVARSVPTNYIVLAIFTLTESYLFSLITGLYEPLTVAIAAGITLGMV